MRILALSLLDVIGSLPLFNQDIMERDGLPAGVPELTRPPNRANRRLNDAIRPGADSRVDRTGG